MNVDFRKPIATYAAWRIDEKARALSSSGGIASVISETWVKNGGVVYGASFVKPFGIKHVRCSTIEELKMLRGSKYVQSSMTGVIKLISEDLNNGLMVLFIGTPCQVAGIVKRFSQYASRLYTIDIICHGTPSQYILLESLPANALNIDFDNVEFRENNNFKLSFKSGESVVWSRPLSHDFYMKGFFKAIFYRECCYKCNYARKERVSDMTLGDFWGVDLKAVNTTMDKGISLVLSNTSKGSYLLNMVNDQVVTVPRTLEEAISGNKQLSHPMAKTWRHLVFKSLYPKIGFKWAAIFAMPDIVLKNLFK